MAASNKSEKYFKLSLPMLRGALAALGESRHTGPAWAWQRKQMREADQANFSGDCSKKDNKCHV